MKIDGGCHCGAITYRAEIDPETVIVCQVGILRTDTIQFPAEILLGVRVCRHSFVRLREL